MAFGVKIRDRTQQQGAFWEWYTTIAGHKGEHRSQIAAGGIPRHHDPRRIAPETLHLTAQGVKNGKTILDRKGKRPFRSHRTTVTVFPSRGVIH